MLSYESNDHASTIADLGWNPDGSGIAVAVTMVLRQRKKRHVSTNERFKLSFSLSPDASYLNGEQDSTVHFWHRKSGEDFDVWISIQSRC